MPNTDKQLVDTVRKKNLGLDEIDSHSEENETLNKLFQNITKPLKQIADSSPLNTGDNEDRDESGSREDKRVKELRPISGNSSDSRIYNILNEKSDKDDVFIDASNI